MATSSGKTIALILLVALILLLVWRVTPLFIAPFGVFTGMYRGLDIPHLKNFHFGPLGFRFSSVSFLSLLLLVFWIVIIVWVYRDAERRGMNGMLWALLVFIGNLIGLIIYLIVRTDSAPVPLSTQTMQPCPNCQKSVGSDFAFCPHCGTRLQKVCPKCEKPVEQSWNVCADCGEKLKE